MSATTESNSESYNQKKIAIVLFNLGGPDSLSSVKPFLFNLFYDPLIIRLPNPWRWTLAKMISFFRNNKAKNIYAQIGGKSPILEETLAQSSVVSQKLQNVCKDKFKVFVCMRHWHPMAEETVGKIKNYNPSEIILLPLYPHFSTTTTLSAIQNFNETLKKTYQKEFLPTIKTICCYPKQGGFTQAYAELIKQTIANNDNFRILFSAHSLPVKIIQQGDPYKWQIEQSVKAIVEELNITDLDYRICYQSKVGPIEWLKPSTEEEITQCANDNKTIIIVPISFVSEHSETLVELDIDYKKIAIAYNLKYLRVPTLRINEDFINQLVKMILMKKNDESISICSNEDKRICPREFTQCPCNIN